MRASDRETEWFEDDGSRCPGPGCDCPDCRASRIADRAQRFRAWLGTREATLMLRRMVADNQRMDDDRGEWGDS